VKRRVGWAIVLFLILIPISDAADIGVKYSPLFEIAKTQESLLEVHVYNTAGPENLYVTVGDLRLIDAENREVPLEPWNIRVQPGRENFKVDHQTIEANFFLPYMPPLTSPTQPEVPEDLREFADTCTRTIGDNWAPARIVRIFITPPEDAKTGPYTLYASIVGKPAVGTILGGAVGVNATLHLLVRGPPPPTPIRGAIIITVIVLAVFVLGYWLRKRRVLRV